MCGQLPDVPLCDECYTIWEDPNTEEHDLCADCQEVLNRFCFCCETVSNEPIGEEGVCKDCLKNQLWYKEDSYEESSEEVVDSEGSKG